MSCDKDSLIELDEDVIRKISFDKSPEIKSESSYDFKRYRDRIEKLVQDEKKVIEELGGKMNSYNRVSTEEDADRKEKKRDIEKIIAENYKLVKGYNYNSYYINKYLSKKSDKVDISDGLEPAENLYADDSSQRGI